MTAYDVAVLKKANECAKYLKSTGGENGNQISEKAGKDIKKFNEETETPIKNTAKIFNSTTSKEKESNKKPVDASPSKNKKQKPTPTKATLNEKDPTSLSKNKKPTEIKNNPYNKSSEIQITPLKNENRRNSNENDYRLVEGRVLKDTSAQTIIHGTTNQKLVMLKDSNDSFSSQDDDEEDFYQKAKNESKKRLSKKKSNGKLLVSMPNKSLDVEEDNNPKTDDAIEPMYNENKIPRETSKISHKQKSFNNNTSSELNETERIKLDLEKKAKLEAEKEDRDKRNDNRNKNLSNAYGTTVPMLRLKNNNNEIKNKNDLIKSESCITNSKMKKDTKPPNGKILSDNTSINPNKETNGFLDGYDEIYVSSPERTAKNENSNNNR